MRIESLVSSSGYESSISGGAIAGAKSSVSFDGKVSTKESDTITKIRSKYYEILPKLRKMTLDLLMKSKQSLVLFYDDMDQFEESIPYDYFMSLMKNMIYSADRLNGVISEYNNSKICLILRKDIVDALQHQTNNLNKQITDSGIEIHWFNTVKEPSEHPLMQMVLHKIKNSGMQYKGTELKEIYTEMFDGGTFGFLMERGLGDLEILFDILIYVKSFPRLRKNYY
ncbi:hypothetical protein AAFF39_03600 [Lactococcus garvieae]